MIFDFSHVLPWASQEVKGETGSVNEADYLCWNLLAAEEGGEDIKWVWFCGECVAPPIQLMRLVGGVVQWPCGMCEQCGLVGSVCYLWDWLQASSSQLTPGFPEELDGACVGAVLLLAFGPASRPIEDFRFKRTHPLIMGNERGVVR